MTTILPGTAASARAAAERERLQLRSSRGLRSNPGSTLNSPAASRSGGPGSPIFRRSISPSLGGSLSGFEDSFGDNHENGGGCDNDSRAEVLILDVDDEHPEAAGLDNGNHKLMNDVSVRTRSRGGSARSARSDNSGADQENETTSGDGNAKATSPGPQSIFHSRKPSGGWTGLNLQTGSNNTTGFAVDRADSNASFASPVARQSRNSHSHSHTSRLGRSRSRDRRRHLPQHDDVEEVESDGEGHVDDEDEEDNKPAVPRYQQSNGSGSGSGNGNTGNTNTSTRSSNQEGSPQTKRPPSTDTSTSHNADSNKSSQRQRKTFRDVAEDALVAMLKKKPKKVPELQTREDFRHFFGGCSKKTMTALLTKAYVSRLRTRFGIGTICIGYMVLCFDVAL